MVVGFIVVIVAAVSGMVVDPSLVVPSPLDSAPPDEAPPELASPPLLLLPLLPSLVAFSVSLALDDIEPAAVADPLYGSSSRLSTEQATPSTPTITASIRMRPSSPTAREAVREFPQPHRGNL